MVQEVERREPELDLRVLLEEEVLVNREVAVEESGPLDVRPDEGALLVVRRRRKTVRIEVLAVTQILPRIAGENRHGRGKNLSSGQYFNPNCFAPPSNHQQGALIWPYIKGPAFFNSDLAIYKDFLFKEHQKVEFRFSAFNFLNHPLNQLGISGNSDLNLNFSGPGGSLSQTNLNATTNGKALYKDEVPRVIEFAVKYNF